VSWRIVSFFKRPLAFSALLTSLSIVIIIPIFWFYFLLLERAWLAQWCSPDFPGGKQMLESSGKTDVGMSSCTHVCQSQARNMLRTQRETHKIRKGFISNTRKRQKYFNWVGKKSARRKNEHLQNFWAWNDVGYSGDPKKSLPVPWEVFFLTPTHISTRPLAERC
jgi:hypothetical protein